MQERHSLKKELTIFMLLASVVSLISVGAAVCYVFFSFFFPNTREDIEYVLNSITQQYQSHMQFIEDGAVSIRHNSMLDNFFKGEPYEQGAAERQLVHSMELFADRNRVNQQVPFVTSMYLFNNKNQCVSEYYYATTLAAEEEKEEHYKNIQREFKEKEKQYECIVDDKVMSLIFRIYDDDMKEKGIGIAQISLEAIELVFGELKNYQDYSWMLVSKDGSLLFAGGDVHQNSILKEITVSWSGMKNIQDVRVIGSADVCGFGLRTVIAVGQNNILAILRPSVIVFLVGLIVVLLLTFLVSYGISYRLTRPVTQMITSIRAFGSRKLDVRMEDSSIQEFHDIGMVFNEMADRIEYLITEVYEKQLLATQSQVKYLQSQLNPHFMFNILAMLSLKAKMAGNEELYESLKAFSKLIQGKIFREKEIKIKVKEEMEIVQFYLFLQKERYQDKLTYEIDMEEQMKENLIPRLLIEPLVENAVSHGLEPKKGTGRIKIRLYEKEEEGETGEMCKWFHITVEDNGVGIDYEKMEEKNLMETERDKSMDHTHTGIENTRRMLQILYGDNYQFEIQSEKGKGTKIEITVPTER